MEGAMTRTLVAAFASTAVAWLLLGATASAGSVTATIDISSQVMRVSVNGIPQYSWAVSTARRGYVTPVGTYRPQRLERSWYSRKYNMSPMPHSIFFKGGYAIHGTNYLKQLGQPASHGCVRLHPQNAATLFALVKAHGMANTRIVVTR
jgi:lipoprotein-anchoring transpeptidase ErfK/SrfK